MKRHENHKVPIEQAGRCAARLAVKNSTIPMTFNYYEYAHGSRLSYTCMYSHHTLKQSVER